MGENQDLLMHMVHPPPIVILAADSVSVHVNEVGYHRHGTLTIRMCRLYALIWGECSMDGQVSRPILKLTRHSGAAQWYRYMAFEHLKIMKWSV